MPITGMTRLIGVVGDPIDRARAPEALNEMMGRLGIDVVTVPIGMAPEGLSSLMKSVRSWRNLAGLLITMPYKLEASWLIDDLCPQARLTGAVNVIRREANGHLAGELTDGAGFVASLDARRIPIAHRRVCMLGAGGVGRAIAFALLDAGAASISIINRSKDRAIDLRNDLADHFGAARVTLGDPASITAAEILVNATSVGGDLDPRSPIDQALIPAGAVVAEVVAKPEMTELLTAAEARGCTIVRGTEMQRAQLRSIIEFLLPGALTCDA